MRSGRRVTRFAENPPRPGVAPREDLWGADPMVGRAAGGVAEEPGSAYGSRPRGKVAVDSFAREPRGPSRGCWVIEDVAATPAQLREEEGEVKGA